MTRMLYAVILGFVGALLVHISALFLIPRMAENDAWARLSKTTQPGVFSIIDEASDIASSMRAFDPNFVMAACQFSLGDGPVSLAGNSAPDFWSLSVFNRQGANIFSINDRSMQGGVLDVVVATPLQLIEFQKDMPPELANSVFAEADVKDGFVVLRAFVPEASMKAEVTEFIKTASCDAL
jgi:uncharacterized membrane protein